MNVVVVAVVGVMRERLKVERHNKVEEISGSPLAADEIRHLQLNFRRKFCFCNPWN
jgi:hypothetical protein